MRKLIRSVRLTAPSIINLPLWQSTNGWLDGLQRQPSGRVSAPTNPTPFSLSHKLLLLQHRDAPDSLLGHLFSYKKYWGKGDVVTTSKAPKEKSEEAEGKTIIKIEFLLIKIHNFFYLSGIIQG